MDHFEKLKSVGFSYYREEQESKNSSARSHWDAAGGHQTGAGHQGVEETQDQV